MRTPLSDLFVGDARRFGERLAAFAPRLGQPAPEPVTERIGRGLLVYAEHVLSIVQELREHFLDRIAERTCPWWLRPIPSATVVSFEPCSGADIPTRTTLASRPVDGVVCSFRTLRPLHVGPYRVGSASVESTPGEPSVVSIKLESRGPLAEAFAAGEVSLFFGGDREAALALVHAITTEAIGVSWSSDHWTTPAGPVPPVGPAPPLQLPPDCLTRPGFDPDEALAPDPDGLPSPFGIVSEAILAPDKFRFVRLGGLEAFRDRPPTDTATLTIKLPSSFFTRALDVRAHCVPAVNLFEATTEPVPLDFIRHPQRLRVTGLSARHGGIYAVRDVHATDRANWSQVRLPDRRRHTASAADTNAPATFAVTRERTDGALRIHFAPRHERASDGAHIVSARVLATNRAHASTLRAGDVVGHISTSAGELRYVSVVAASPFVERPTGTPFRVRALSEASVRASSPLRSLRRAIALAFPTWALSDSQAATFQTKLRGLSKLDVRLARRETKSRAIQAGYRYALTVDESSFVGIGERGLFGAAIAEALARCVPLTAFLELVVLGAKTGTSTTYRRGALA